MRMLLVMLLLIMLTCCSRTEDDVEWQVTYDTTMVSDYAGTPAAHVREIVGRFEFSGADSLIVPVPVDTAGYRMCVAFLTVYGDSAQVAKAEVDLQQPSPSGVAVFRTSADSMTAGERYLAKVHTTYWRLRE